MATSLANRPYVKIDANQRAIYDSVDDLAFQGEYDGANNLIYKGFARVGANTASPVWQLAKMTYDASNNLLSITWPVNSFGAPSSDYEFAWTLRATYTYI